MYQNTRIAAALVDIINKHLPGVKSSVSRLETVLEQKRRRVNCDCDLAPLSSLFPHYLK